MIEIDLASARSRQKSPAVLEVAEGTIEIFDEDRRRGGIQRHARLEGLTDRAVAHAHPGDEDAALGPGVRLSTVRASHRGRNSG